MPLAVSATIFKGLKFSTRTHERRELLEQVEVLDTGVVGDVRDTAIGRRGGERFGCHATDLTETRVPTDRTSSGKAELYAVVGRRVVRRREHRPCEVEPPRREVKKVGRCQADIDNTESDREQARAERATELDARLTDVTCHDDSLVGRALREHERAEADSHRIDDAGIELIGNRTPDVVGLEDVIEGRPGGSRRVRRHGKSSLVGTQRVATMAMMVTVLNAM